MLHDTIDLPVQTSRVLTTATHIACQQDNILGTVCEFKVWLKSTDKV